MKPPNAIDVKVIEGVLYHHFTIYPDHRINYAMLIDQGNLVGIAEAGLGDLLEEEDGHIIRLVIRTRAYAFEVVPVTNDRNSRFFAYKILRKQDRVVLTRHLMPPQDTITTQPSPLDKRIPMNEL